MKAAALPARHDRVLADVIALGKPRITFMVLVTTLAGLRLAPSPLSWPRTIVTLIGVALIVAAANAFNMYLERDVDALMRRTENRPLPAGRLMPEIALGFALFCLVFSVPMLRVAANPLTAGLALLSFILYVAAYTPLKRRSTVALYIGAVPGALPALIGYTASTAKLEAPGLYLFALLFVWQIPHFIAISLFRADDYARAGLKVVPNVFGAEAARVSIIMWSLVQLAASLALARLGGPFYLAVACVTGALLLALAAAGARTANTARWAKYFFLYSILYLPVVFGALVLGR